MNGSPRTHVDTKWEQLSAAECAAHYVSFLFSLYECQPNLFDYLSGVIGSVIHYPKDMTEMTPDVKDNGYRTL